MPSTSKRIFDATRTTVNALDKEDRFLTFQPEKDKIITIDLKEVIRIECNPEKKTIFINDDLFVYFPGLNLDITFPNYYAQLVGAWIKFKHKV